MLIFRALVYQEHQELSPEDCKIQMVDSCRFLVSETKVSLPHSVAVLEGKPRRLSHHSKYLENPSGLQSTIRECCFLQLVLNFCNIQASCQVKNFSIHHHAVLNILKLGM